MVMVLFGLVAILVCMQDMGGNEKSTGLAGRIRERIHAWKFRYPWIARLFCYSAILVVVLGVCHWAFNYFNLYHTDADSARYMLSAMVQAQAAIVAIVITLTLIAVQLTASAYSPRVIRIFRDNPDMWLLLGFYGLSMLYGLVVLKMVVGGAGAVVSQDVFWSLGRVSISFEFCVSFAYWLEVFTLVALFPYMLNIINLLEPENIINRLAENITKGNVLKFIKSKEKQRWNRTSPAKDDPMQPIMDVIHGSVMKYDIATTRIGLKAVTNRAIEIIDSDSQEEISKCFCGHLERVGCRLGASRGDEESTVEVIENLYNFGKSTVEKRLGDAADKAAESLGVVGIAAVEKRLEDAAMRAARSLTSVGTYAVENELGGVASQVAKSLKNVGIAAAENKLGLVTTKAVWTLETIGKAAVEKRLGHVVWQAAKSLAGVGTAAVENELEKADQAANILANLTISSGEIIENAIQCCELQLQEQDRGSFRKFMQMYAEKLEKLRTEKSE